MIRLLFALILAAAGGSLAWATSRTRADMETNVTPSPSILGDMIDSAANLLGSNTFSGQNLFTNKVTSFGAINYPESLPVISSCGTNPPAVAAGSSNSAGQFTLGTGTPTACTVTFLFPYTTHSFCQVTPASSGGAAISGGYYLSANDKTGFTLTLGTGTSSLVFNYSCAGN